MKDDEGSRAVKVQASLCIVAVVLLAVVVGSCGGDSIEEPAFAKGVTGPAVVDEAGIVADWEFIDGSDGSLGAAELSDDYRIPSIPPESAHFVVVWGGLPCQTRPVAQVIEGPGSVHIDVTPGPSDPPDCAAMEVYYGFRFMLTGPVGDRTVTATVIDYVNQVRLDFPPE